MYKYIIIGVACGLAAGLFGGFFLEKFFKSLKDNSILKCRKKKKKSFGEPMFANKFTRQSINQSHHVLRIRT